MSAAELEGWGSLIGGAADLTSGLLGAWQSSRARNRANKAIDSWETEANKLIDNNEANQTKFSTDGDLQKYQQLKNNFDPNDFIYDFDKFDSSKYNVEDYVNQNKDRILADVGKGVQATAAGAGLGHSSGALNSIVNAQMDKSEELYNNAYNRMNTERQFDYNEYNNYIQNMQNKLNLQMQGQMNQMNMLQGDLQFDQQQKNDNLNNRLSLGNSLAQSRASLV